MSQPEQIIEKIKARRSEIERLRFDIGQRQEMLRQELSALETEDRDLTITERTVARLLPNQPIAPIGEAIASVVAAVAPLSTKPSRKPDGLPTVIEMATVILSDAASRGQPWLDASQIADEIKKRWWPDAETAFVTPQIWRAATKRNVFRKEGTRYALSTGIEKGPTDKSERPSQTNGTEDSAVQAASVSSGRDHHVTVAVPSAHQPKEERSEA
jgi:hypothetical protein